MPRAEKTIQNHFLLTAALEGLELQKQRLEEQIREVRSLLGSGARHRGRPLGLITRKRGPGRLSAAARKRIGAAQKRRWAEYRKSAGGKAE